MRGHVIDPQKWERIGEVFDGAMALPADERTRFIEQSCADREMADAVFRLIAEGERAGEFLHQPVARLGELLAPPVPGRVGTKLGKYQIVGEIGRGGTGVVYLAREVVSASDAEADSAREVVIKLLLDEAQASRWLKPCPS